MARPPSPKFKFGEWLPDQAELDNEGLTECLNVLRVGGSYVPYQPFVSTSPTVEIGATMRGARRVLQSGGNSYIVVGTDAHLYYGAGTGTITVWNDITPAGGVTSGNFPRIFTQYEQLVIEAQETRDPVYWDLSAGGLFTQLTGPFGDAPKAGAIGIIGQFVMLGNLGDAAHQEYSAVQWSGIDAPLNWPTPNSADAIAQQSSKQMLDVTLGVVRGISQGDQWGIILLNSGLVRVTYVGGDAVLGFDTIYRGPGPLSANSWLKFGALIYFASTAGFFVTDGVNVTPIGLGKVNQYFIDHVDLHVSDAVFNVRCSADWTRRLIYFAWSNSVGGILANELLIYSVDEKSWTHAIESISCFVLGEEGSLINANVLLEAFDDTPRCGRFTGTPGTATLITGETELNPGGTSLVSGVRPQISGTTRDKITISVGARNDQTDETPVVYTTGGAIDAFTGQSDMIVDARYLRAKFEIQGAYTKAIGGEFDAQPTSNG